MTHNVINGGNGRGECVCRPSKFPRVPRHNIRITQMRQPLIQIFTNAGEEITLKYISSKNDAMVIEVQDLIIHPDDLITLKNALRDFIEVEGYDCE